jgi:phage terminase large subunit-like protein
LMKDAIKYALHLETLVVNTDTDIIDFIGTRWGLQDLYKALINAYSADNDLAYFARADIEGGQPIFPEKFSLKSLARIRNADPVLYYANYKNDPIGDGAKDFDKTSLRYFVFGNNGDLVYRDEHQVRQRWPRSALDIVITVDPNSGEPRAPDYPAIVVSGMSPKGQVFVLETWSRRVDPAELVDQIFLMAKRWHPRVIGIEKAGQQNTAFYFKRKSRKEGYWPRVEALRPHNRDKGTRIRGALSPLLNERLLFVQQRQETLIHQIEFHPDLENDDEADALAYGAEPQMWRMPLSREEQREVEDAKEAIMKRRNVHTGYSA